MKAREMLKISVNLLFHLIICSILLSSMEPAYANGDISVESIWIDTDEESQRLMFAQFIGDEWQDESLIYETANAMTSLALGTGISGEKLIVWTEQKRLKTELMYMTASKVDGALKWTQAATFSNKGHENFSASIVYDSTGTAWVFWASTSEDFSDIVLRRFDGSWGEAEQVHTKNSVPDIKPRASITESGDVLVDWVSYDFQVGDYVNRSRQYRIAARSDDQITKLLLDKVQPNNVQLPPNMYTGAQALMHFPTNQMIQSVLYKQGSVIN